MCLESFSKKSRISDSTYKSFAGSEFHAVGPAYVKARRHAGTNGYDIVQTAGRSVHFLPAHMLNDAHVIRQLPCQWFSAACHAKRAANLCKTSETTFSDDDNVLLKPSGFVGNLILFPFQFLTGTGSFSVFGKRISGRSAKIWRSYRLEFGAGFLSVRTHCTRTVMFREIHPGCRLNRNWLVKPLLSKYIWKAFDALLPVARST